jgi:hypothetical protein
MSKKTFAAAPKPRQPSADEIDAFERNGAGHDRRAAAAATVPVESTKRLSLDLPISIHTRFKTACSATNRKMVNEIQDLIERRTAELEEEAGISRK